ncbi:MAG: hypothetical protein HY319_27665 [Armatimonadetes bacterium]|nr:hypothetical protein [Armatimonadota bacterium]
MRPARGLSLVETIMATFLLVSGFVVTAVLYHTSLRYASAVERQQLALLVAENKLEEIRAWSRDVHGTGGSESFGDDVSWNTYDGAVETDPDHPEFTVRVQANRHSLFSPSSQFEQVRFSAQEGETETDPPDFGDPRKGFTNSTRRVEITVEWGPGPREEVRLISLVGDPVRDFEASEEAITIGMNPSTTTLAPGEDIRLTAVAKDTSGQEIPDAVFTWYVEPDGAAAGTLIYDAGDSASCRFVNQILIEEADPDLITYAPGTVRIGARARLGGEEAVGWTPMLTLFGP